MFDFHQGNTAEVRDARTPPTVGEVAMAELEVANLLSKGRLRVAAKQQVLTWKLAARVAADAVKARLQRRL